MNRKKTGLFVLAIGSLGLLLLPALAGAHAHPKGGTPFRVPLVISMVNCTGSMPAGEAHTTPPALPSCSNTGAASGTPGGQSSSQLTVGSPDANGAAANSVAGAILNVCGNASGGGFFPAATCVAPDVQTRAHITDVRCQVNSATAGDPCGDAGGPNANTLAGNDYSGSTTAVAVIRITDHANAPNVSATLTTTPFPAPQFGGGQCLGAANPNCSNGSGSPIVPFPCVTPTPVGIGSTCNTNTTVNSYSPGTVTAGKLGNIEIQTVNILDGVSGTFMTQGIFIP